MTFEDQLARAFETLTERLRGEIDREVERRTAESAAAQADRPAEAVETPGPVAAANGASLERLAGGFDAIDAARSLTAVLDALLSFAADEAPDASIWLIRGGRRYRWRAAGSAAGDDDTPLSSLEEGIALAIAGQTVAVLERGDTQVAPDIQHSELSLLARYAAKSLESLTAFAAARALTQPIADRGLRIADSDGNSRGDSGADSEDAISARRYARLLVSEIKLYHEPAVIDGRRDRDLATRLGGEITRARVMYEQRVPPHVRDRYDYFQEELVRTLADGDSSLLVARA